MFKFEGIMNHLSISAHHYNLGFSIKSIGSLSRYLFDALVPELTLEISTPESRIRSSGLGLVKFVHRGIPLQQFI